MRARRARPSDAHSVFILIAEYAEQGLLLRRAEEEIRRNISHFLVHEEARDGKKRIVSCVALESYGADLAEIRSLAVRQEMRGRRVGAKLLSFALEEARDRGIARVFAVTHAPEFFVRQGFAATPRQALTEKIERDCCTCSKRRSCQLTAVIATVIPERIALPILGDSATPVSAA
jgi:amino-acid N-acetyltransferase